MTERQIKKRQRFKERRQRWITVNSVALVMIVIMIAGLFVAHNKLSKETYIEYAESSSVQYSVKIPKDAPFYSEYLDEFKEFADENGDLWIPSNYAYPTSAATTVKIDINYVLEVCAPDIDYAYTYRITAQPEVVDGATKSKFPLPKTILEEETEPQYENSNAKLHFKKSVEIDYHQYDNLVKDFEKKMEIKNATENLIITMEVEVVGMSEILHKNSENACVIKVTMPLNENAFDINYSTTSSNCGDCKIVDGKSPEELQYLIDFAKVLGAVGLVILVILFVGINLTKNHDVTYYTKIQRLVNSYRSFIQKVEGGFDVTGYQIVIIASFREMLAIRDTIQSPVLMSENSDKTRTQFFIPTNTKILYLFEIKVDNYDKLYKKHPDWVDDSIIDTSNIRHVAATPVVTPAEVPVAATTEASAPAVTNNYSTVTNNVHNDGDRFDYGFDGRDGIEDRRSERRNLVEERRSERRNLAEERKAERRSLAEERRADRRDRLEDRRSKGRGRRGEIEEMNVRSSVSNAPVAAPVAESTQQTPAANPAFVNNQSAPVVNGQPVYYAPVANAQPVYYAPVANAQPVYYAPVANAQAPVARNGYTTSGCKSASLYVDGQQKVVTNQGGCYPCKTTVNVMLGGCSNAGGENTVNVISGNCQNGKIKK